MSIAVQTDTLTPEIMESVIVGNDLSKLSIKQRLSWYMARCDAAGLDPRTQPFIYVNLSGKLTLYATKSASDSLIGLRGLTVEITERQYDPKLGIYEARCRVTLPTGRHVEDVGAVYAANLKGEGLCNAIMKAVTKAKRRTVLSACGLGMSDESEIDDFPHTATIQSQLPQLTNGTVRNGKNSPESRVPGQGPSGVDTRPYHALVTEAVAAINVEIEQQCADRNGGEVTATVSALDFHRTLFNAAIQTDRLPGPPPKTPSLAIKELTALYGRDRDWVRERLNAYLAEELETATDGLGADAEPDASQDATAEVAMAASNGGQSSPGSDAADAWAEGRE